MFVETSLKETLPLLYLLIVNNDLFSGPHLKNNIQTFKSTKFNPSKNTQALDQRFSARDSDESAEDFNDCVNIAIQLMGLCQNFTECTKRIMEPKKS